MAATPVPDSTPNMPWLPTGPLPAGMPAPKWDEPTPSDPD